MPRGIDGATGKANCHIQRYVCPNCNRKGLHILFYPNGSVGYRKMWTCMYHNSFYFKKCDFVLTEYDNPAVIAANPELK